MATRTVDHCQAATDVDDATIQEWSPVPDNAGRRRPEVYGCRRRRRQTPLSSAEVRTSVKLLPPLYCGASWLVR